MSMDSVQERVDRVFCNVIVGSTETELRCRVREELECAISEVMTAFLKGKVEPSRLPAYAKDASEMLKIHPDTQLAFKKVLCIINSWRENAKTKVMKSVLMDIQSEIEFLADQSGYEPQDKD